MNNQNLVKLLDEVPETKLALVAIASEITLPDGSIDLEQAEERNQEIEEANDEAKHYMSQTNRLAEIIKCKFTPRRD